MCDEVAGASVETDEPEETPTGPFARYVSIAAPAADLSLHVVGGSGGQYALKAEAGSGGVSVASEELRGTAGADTVVSSPALQAIQPAFESPPGGTTTAGSMTASSTTRAADTTTSSRTGGGPTVSRAPTTARIASVVLGEIVPSGKAAKIAAVLKVGGYLLAFHAPTAGTAVVSWFQVPRGAKVDKRRVAAVLLATGHLAFSAAGTRSMRLKLTPAGKRLLARARRVRLTAKGTFTATGQAPITVTRDFVLTR